MAKKGEKRAKKKSKRQAVPARTPTRDPSPADNADSASDSNPTEVPEVSPIYDLLDEEKIKEYDATETNLVERIGTLAERLSELDKRARFGLGVNNPTYQRDMPLFCRPIGFIKSAYRFKNGTPRQGVLCPDVRAELRIRKEVFTNAEHSLEGLRDFTHIWLIFWFHLNNETASTKAKVKPPRLANKVSKGVFATRSPHRPNPLGLSLVRLDQVIGDTLYLTGVDLVDGSPVLDVKPFIDPYDAPVKTRKEAPHPNWVTLVDEEFPCLNTIEFSSLALRKIKRFHKRCANNCNFCLRFIDDTLLLGAMKELLKSDLRSRCRRAKCSDRVQFVLIDNVKVSVWYDDEGNVHVLNVAPYNPQSNQDDDDSDPDQSEHGCTQEPVFDASEVQEVFGYGEDGLVTNV